MYSTCTVKELCYTTYEALIQDNFAKGEAAGEKKLAALFLLLMQNGKNEDAVRIMKDREYYKKILKEYGLAE